MKAKNMTITRFSAGYSLPREIHDFVESKVYNKAYTLENEFFQENQYLPKQLIKDSISNKILQVNKKIENLRNKYKFERVQSFDYERKNKTLLEEDSPDKVGAVLTFIDDDGVKKTADIDIDTYELSNIKNFQEPEEELNSDGIIDIEKAKFLIDSCMKSLTHDEIQEYFNFIPLIDENTSFENIINGVFDNLISLPKIQLIVDYLSLVRFYDKLLIDFNDLQNGRVIASADDKYRFNTTLSRKQISTLYNKLVIAKLIPKITEERTFLWAFGIGEDSTMSYVGWIGTKNLAPYLIDSLSKYLKDGNKWVIGENIFGVKDMAKKVNRYFNNGNFKHVPRNHTIIDEIVESTLRA